MNQLCTDSNELLTAVIAACTSVVTVLALGMRAPRRRHPTLAEMETWGKAYARMARAIADQQPDRGAGRQEEAS